MSREAHVPFCEGLQGRFLRSTQLTYREDLSRIGDREAAEVFALFRRIALNMAQHHPKSISKRRKIKCACWSDDFRMEMFFGVTTDANCSQKV